VNILSGDALRTYNGLGINPLELACGCAVKVDLDSVIYPAMRELRSKLSAKNFEISARKDAEIVEAKEDVQIHRRFYTLGENTNVDSEDVKKISPTTCVALIQVYQRYASDPERFKELVEPVYRKISESGTKLRLGKAHSIITTTPDESVAIFDFIVTKGKFADKFLAINNDTVNIIDPTISMEDERQIAGAISNALNDLFVLGIYEEIQIAPLLGVSDGKVRVKMMEQIIKFSRENNFKMLEVPQIDSKRLLMGSTVLGCTEKHPPIEADLVKPGMVIAVTRPFGELAPITVYASSLLDPSIISEMESKGISQKDLLKAKDKALEIIAKPNLKAAKIVSKRLPYIRQNFKEDEHILLTSDVSGPGVYIFYEVAERSKACIQLSQIPLLFPEICEFATSNFIMPNSTAGTNGAFCIVMSKSITEDVIRDLRRAGYDPRIVGEVVDIGKAKVRLPKEALKYVANLKHPLLKMGE
jgi:selenophosphate synthase